MQSSIILLLIIFILLSIWCYYFGFFKPDPIFDTENKAGFIFSAFIMVPILVFALWNQSRAIPRLAKTGIIPHPAIVESVGIAAGIGIGDSVNWVFKANSSPEEIMAFYQKDDNRKGWDLTSSEPVINMLILKRNKQNMTILVYKDWTSLKIIYMLSNKK